MAEEKDETINDFSDTEVIRIINLNERILMMTKICEEMKGLE